MPPGHDVPLTVLVGGTGPGLHSLDTLARRLAVRLAHGVEAWAPDTSMDRILSRIQERVDRGTVRLVILPLALARVDRVHGAVIDLVASVRDRWPGLCLHRGASPMRDDVARILGDRARQATDALSSERAAAGRTVVLLTGIGGASPAVNAELAWLARLVYEAHRFAEVGYAFLEPTSPTVGESIGRWARLGASSLVVVPYALFAGGERRRIADEARRAARAAGISVAIARACSPHPALVGALVRRHLEALRDGALGGAGSAGSLPYVRPELLLALRNTHGHDDGPLRDFEARMAAMLPPATKVPRAS